MTRPEIQVSRMIGYPDDYEKPEGAPIGRVKLSRIRDESFGRASTEEVPVGLVNIFDRITGRKP